MSIKRLIAANTLYQLLAKFVSVLATLVISVIFTRLLGNYLWGEYAIVVSYITFFYLFTEFGLNGIAARDFSSKAAIKLADFSNFFLVRLLNTIFVCVFSIIILSFLNYSFEIKQAILISHIGLFFFSLSSSFNALFQSKLIYKYLFYITLAFSIVNLCLFYLFISYGVTNLSYLVIPQLIADILRFVVACFFASKVFSEHKFYYNFKMMKYFFISSLPLGLALIFNTLMTQVDKIMLSVMVAPVQVGYYALAYKLFDVLLVLPTFFMNVVFTIWAKKYSESKNYSKHFTISVYLLFFVSMFVTLVSTAVSWIFIPMIWGESLKPAVLVFNILIIGSVIFYLSSPISWSFVVENKQHFLAFFYFFGFVLNFILNLLVIPKYGVIGAAYTTIFTELIILLVLELYRRKYLSVKFTKVSFSDLNKIFFKS